MKAFLAFILLLVNSTFLMACGFYPYGEDVRYCFVKPHYFNYHSFSEFDYSSQLFMPKIYNQDANEQLWQEYCNNQVSTQSIHHVLETFSENEINIVKGNDFIQYLNTTNDHEALAYLKFAKRCEKLNTFYDDPWERHETFKPQSNPIINEAVRRSKFVKKEILKIRYLFLATRLSFYRGDHNRVNQLFKEISKCNHQKSILYYWSLYFNTLSEPNKALANYYAAQVFANAPDKRFVVYDDYSLKIPIQQTIAYATTKKEKANIYVLAAIRKYDRALTHIKQVYRYAPKSSALSFLVLREINKIEDWVLTPYYSQFQPSVDYNTELFNAEYGSTPASIFKRMKQDRLYASEVLSFLNGIDANNTNDPTLWKLAKAQLLFISQQYAQSIAIIKKLEKTVSVNDSIYKPMQQIKALCLTAMQKKGDALIPHEVKPILMKYKNEAKFIFAIGRELEYKGNTSDAALLYATINNDYTTQWKSAQTMRYDEGMYFLDWFNYIDITYSPDKIQSLINNITEHKNPKDDFSKWLYTTMLSNTDKLYDLLGTQYIRRNFLEKANTVFSKINPSYWDTNYSFWENDGSAGYAVFNENPFFKLKYTPAFSAVKDTIKLNKATITQQLITYLKRAENPKEKDRDYYYFLSANCYYNMSFTGNAWMMRRFGFSISGEDYMIDEYEFRNLILAKHYYLKAYKNAKKNKFKALCMRMLTRCEKTRLENLPHSSFKNEAAYDEYMRKTNRYYQILEKKYNRYYYDLIGNCEAFEDYFNSRR